MITRCSFCGQKKKDKKRFVTSPDEKNAICETCLDFVSEIYENWKKDERALKPDDTQRTD